MIDPSGSGTDLSTAFDALVDLVRNWRAESRVTTTAGVKPALMKSMPGFDERVLGFATFRDFVRAAQDAGLVHLAQLPTLHWVILLPGEQLDAVERPSAAQAGAEAATSSDGLRLKPAVWSSFVEWNDGIRRLWDLESQRVFVYPIDGAGRPAWESSPDRFVDVNPVSSESQIGFMAEWATAQPEPARARLLAAIAESSPRGEFRRELERLGLVESWRRELQRRVRAAAIDWATSSGVDPEALFDRHVPRRSTPSVPSTTPVLSKSAANSGEYVARRGDLTTALRERLHAVIDQMTMSELVELRVPVAYLVMG